MQLVQKNVLVGICGGIAAYKTPDLVRKLKAEGANVRVVLTESATHFVSSLSLQAVSGEKVSTHLLDEDAELGMGHIELAKWADYFIVAPATANTIAKLAHGIADDLLTTLAIATSAEIFITPAMNQQMWSAPVTQSNMQMLLERGYIQLGPASGEQACGDVGAGRMLEPIDIVECVVDAALSSHDNTQANTPKNSTSNLLRGLRVMITAGPTREAIDPVRYISNHSSGKMGFALAKAATSMGAEVHLVAGPVSIDAPNVSQLTNVISADDMHTAVHDNIAKQDIFIACAAVADYKVDQQSTQKMKKTDNDKLTLKFVPNPDILKSVAALDTPPFTVGFAAETQDVENYAKAKLQRKKLNMIAANDVSNPDIGFDSSENALMVFFDDKRVSLPQNSKDLLAVSLLKLVKTEYDNNKTRV